MSRATKRLEATISGRVQGVYFRGTTREQAHALGLTGWVRNEYDGTVRVVAEGDEPSLQRLLTFLHQGPPGAHVTHVVPRWQDATGEFTGFHVRR